jgi:hypothetical protein
MKSDLTCCILMTGAMWGMERTFALAREHQHPLAARRLADVRNPNEATIAQEEGNGGQGT